MFSARLRLPKSVPTTAAEAFVEEVGIGVVCGYEPVSAAA